MWPAAAGQRNSLNRLTSAAWARLPEQHLVHRDRSLSGSPGKREVRQPAGQIDEQHPRSLSTIAEAQ